MEARDLVNALVKSGLTQAAIAERTGIPQPTISKVSRGDVADVLSRNYRKLLALHAERIGPVDATAAHTQPPTDQDEDRRAA